MSNGASAIAARTRRVDIGTTIFLLPLYHPVHVAEDAATLDIISKGRLILGVGMALYGVCILWTMVRRFVRPETEDIAAPADGEEKEGDA